MATELQLKQMKRAPHPDMYDEPPNLSNGKALLHDEEVDCRVRDCHDSAHFRLLDLDNRLEITGSEQRIDAMRELWHGVK